MTEIYDKQILSNQNKNPWDYSKDGITPKSDGIEPLAETDRNLDVGDVININGTAYVVGILSNKGSNTIAAYVTKLSNQRIFIGNEKPKTIFNATYMTCPYCGYEDNDNSDYDDSDDNCICPNCGSTFSYEREITVAYNIEPKYRSPMLKI